MKSVNLAVYVRVRDPNGDSKGYNIIEFKDAFWKKQTDRKGTGMMVESI